MQRICFLFNHDQAHQVAHSLPIALAMAREGRVQVSIASTGAATERRVREIAGADLARVAPVRLGLRSPVSRGLAGALDAIVPARKLLVYRDNLDFFGAIDALVVSEKTSLLLKSRYRMDKLRIVHTRHGAGDRAIGFAPQRAQFDLVLAAGPKIARRLEAQAGVDPKRIRVTGYPKFELCAERKAALRFANPDLPTVLYAPHPSPRLSSWFVMGDRVLRELVNSGRYNVIFAPHVMLFARKFAVTIDPPAIRAVRPPDRDLAAHPNLLIDPGSGASSDMSYTNVADVYVGDVSSQVYEFLLHPRPCLHLDAHGVDWRDDPDYAHWLTGPVAGRDSDIVAAVDQAIATHHAYQPRQRAAFADTFSVTDEPASLRSARAITDFLDG